MNPFQQKRKEQALGRSYPAGNSVMECNWSPPTVPLEVVKKRGEQGRGEDVDFLMATLLEDSSIAQRKSIDYAFSLVEKQEGMLAICFYLFCGQPIQRNYAALYFKRRNQIHLLKKAIRIGCVDERQAFSK